MSTRDNSRAPSRRPMAMRTTPATGTGRFRVKPRRDALTRVRHDLRSVVHAVVGYSNLLASEHYGPMGDDQKAFVQHVRSAALQLEELVDAYVELSRPAAQSVPERSELALSALLSRLRHHLASQALVCNVRIEPGLETRLVAVSMELTERALLELARVVSADGAHGCLLHAHERDGAVVLQLVESPRTQRSTPLSNVDALENELSNRDFIRVKLAEVLLSRQGTPLCLSAERDVAELTFQ